MRRQLLAMRIEHPRAAHRRQDERQIELRAHHRGADIEARRGHRAARPEHEIFERPRIAAQRHFVFGASIDVVEHDRRKPLLRLLPQIGDIHHVGSADGPCHESAILSDTCSDPLHVWAETRPDLRLETGDLRLETCDCRLFDGPALASTPVWLQNRPICRCTVKAPACGTSRLVTTPDAARWA